MIKLNSSEGKYPELLSRKEWDFDNMGLDDNEAYWYFLYEYSRSSTAMVSAIKEYRNQTGIIREIVFDELYFEWSHFKSLTDKEYQERYSELQLKYISNDDSAKTGSQQDSTSASELVERLLARPKPYGKCESKNLSKISKSKLFPLIKFWAVIPQFPQRPAIDVIGNEFWKNQTFIEPLQTQEIQFNPVKNTEDLPTLEFPKKEHTFDVDWRQSDESLKAEFETLLKKRPKKYSQSFRSDRRASEYIRFNSSHYDALSHLGIFRLKQHGLTSSELCKMFKKSNPRSLLRKVSSAKKIIAEFEMQLPKSKEIPHDS